MLFTTKLAALVLATAATMASQTAAVPAPVSLLPTISLQLAIHSPGITL